MSSDNKISVETYEIKKIKKKIDTWRHVAPHCDIWRHSYNLMVSAVVILIAFFYQNGENGVHHRNLHKILSENTQKI